GSPSSGPASRGGSPAGDGGSGSTTGPVSVGRSGPCVGAGAACGGVVGTPSCGLLGITGGSASVATSTTSAGPPAGVHVAVAESAEAYASLSPSALVATWLLTIS